MYNRYVPQPDGSFRRSRMPDAIRHRPEPDAVPECPEEPEVCPPQPECPPPPPSPGKHPGKKPPREGSAGNFLKNLLPKALDTGDILVILLLLLMAGDCPEDQNTALLTLALYLFM